MSNVDVVLAVNWCQVDDCVLTHAKHEDIQRFVDTIDAQINTLDPSSFACERVHDQRMRVEADAGVWERSRVNAAFLIVSPTNAVREEIEKEVLKRAHQCKSRSAFGDAKTTAL